MGYKEIKDMAIGETGWAVFWAFRLIDGKFWIRSDYSTHPSMGGTVTVKIERGQDGVIVLESHPYRVIELGEIIGQPSQIEAWDMLPVLNEPSILLSELANEPRLVAGSDPGFDDSPVSFLTDDERRIYGALPGRFRDRFIDKVLDIHTERLLGQGDGE